MDTEIDTERLIKYIFVGNAETGKISIIIRYTNQDEDFISEYCPTKGVEFRCKSIYINNTRVTLQI